MRADSFERGKSVNASPKWLILLGGNIEQFGEGAAALRGDLQKTRVAFGAHEPALIKRIVEQCSAHRPRDMIFALRPVEAAFSKGLFAAALGEGDAEFAPELCGLRGEVPVLLGEQPLGGECLGDLDGKAACEVIVARACAAQLGRGAGRQRVCGECREHLKRAGNIGVGDAVVDMPTRLQPCDQSCIFEPIKMRCRGLRGDFRVCRELFVGKGAAIHKRGQHAGAGGVREGVTEDIEAVSFHEEKIDDKSQQVKKIRFACERRFERPRNGL